VNFKKNLSRVNVVLAVLLLLLLVQPAPQVNAASLGPNNAGAGANIVGIGTVEWTNPGNITAPGTPYATTNVNVGNPISNYLQGTQYGFNIPAGATIDGITVVINRQASETDPNVLDNVVRLVRGGAIVGDNRAGGTPWPTAFATATYGGPTDLWGTTWTPADINADNFGVVLSVQRPAAGGASRTATVDYMQITVNFTLPDTTTTVDCGGGTPEVTYGSSIACVATVTRVDGIYTPSGTVSWGTDGSGSFETSPCTLIGANGSSTCSVNYLPNAVGGGLHLITAIYSGDDIYESSSGGQSVTVNPRPITVTADAQTKVYGETDPELTYQITAGSLVFGDVFTGGLTRVAGEDAGTYAITQGSLALNSNYILTYIGANLTITRATPTLSVTNSPVFYNGLPQVAVVVGSVPGNPSNILYDGSAPPPVDVGTYAVTADFTPTDTVNYNSLTGASAGNFVINPGGPELTLVKTAAPATFVQVGDVISYSYLLTNSGSVALLGPFTVLDDKALVTCPDTASMAPLESITCNASYAITLGDLVAGFVTNTATGYGFYNETPVSSNSDQETVTTFRIFLPIILK
jgi:hypothetical protein